MEKFITDVNIQPDDVTLSYDPVIEMFTKGEAAIIRSGGSNLVEFRDSGMDVEMMPYFGQNGEQRFLTYLAFQVALNKELENDPTRKKNALRVLEVMLSEFHTKGGNEAYSVMANSLRGFYGS